MEIQKEQAIYGYTARPYHHIGSHRRPYRLLFDTLPRPQYKKSQASR
jgi:hypothetical protein